MLNKEAFNRDFGQRVKAARRGASLRAEDVAEAAGISPQFLSDVERGKKGMGGYNVARLAIALHVSTDYLLYGRKNADAAWELAAERLSALTPAIREMATEVLGTTLDMLQENIPN